MKYRKVISFNPGPTLVIWGLFIKKGKADEVE